MAAAQGGIHDPLSGSETSHKTGLPNPAMEMCFELEICPDLIMAALAAAGAAAFLFLYQAITLAAAKRKRRSSAAAAAVVSGPSLTGQLELLSHNLASFFQAAADNSSSSSSSFVENVLVGKQSSSSFSLFVCFIPCFALYFTATTFDLVQLYSKLFIDLIEVFFCKFRSSFATSSKCI